MDQIYPEILKALDIGRLSWLTCLLNVTWMSGTTFVKWQTRVVVSIFKKGNRRECSNKRGITLLSLPGKFMPGCWRGELESSSKSEVMVLNWKKVESYLWVGDESLPQADKFKCLVILFKSNVKLE